MKILYPMIFFLAVLPYLISHQAYSIPYISPQEEYINSDIVVIGKVISAVPFSSTYTKYQIQVEQYLKNPHNQDVITVIAEGTNKTMVEQGRGPDTVYDVGQRALLYLKNENGNYVAWYFSHSTDSLCDPAPTKDDLNFSLLQDARFSALPAYSPLRVETGIPNLFRVDDAMLIHYDTWNRHFTTKTFDVEFDVKNGTNGELLSNVTKQVELKPCIGHQTVDTSFIPKKAGTYEIDVIFDNHLLGTTVVVEHNVSSVKLEKTPLSPIQQFKEGIKPEYVKCKEGLELVMKSENNSPACVKLDTADNLIKRGWAQPKIIPSKKVHEILPLIPSNTVKSSVNPDNQTSSTLKLFISTDSTYTSPGNPVGVDISLNNTSSTPLILTKSDNWPRNDLSSGPCSNLPFGMAILKGYYTEQNMSNANSLVIFQNIPCPLPAKIKSYTFQPLSTKATQECDSLFSCTGLVDMKTHLEISGFVDNNSPHHPFNIGTYTIIAGDQWGDIAIQHFSEAYTTPLANLKGN